MKISPALLALLAATLPAAALSAQDAAVVAPQTSFVTSDAIRAESDVYFLNGRGPFETWMAPLDTQVDELFFQLANMFSSNPYVEGAGIKPAKPSGTAYNYSLGYDFKLARVPGSFSLETSYTNGVLKDDSDVITSNTSIGGLISGDSTSDLGLQADCYRKVKEEINEVSLLALWRPEGKLGDYLAVGLEYSHGEYSCRYDISYNLTLTLDGVPASNLETIANMQDNIRMDNFLLHVRLGGKPLAVFAQGKYGIVARADLAAGYSKRDDFEFINSRSILGGVDSDDYSHAGKGTLQDTMTFKGSASISGYYKEGANTVELGAGFACQSDFGPDRGDEIKGLMIRAAYKRNW